ncbi:RGS domain-containing protein [Scheffersomyces xylosifermentans]|uniref:RGS domain-containing protein n=1 Tax=Scheffersomyces xylosifermentans TaxID=1304137 RepID=UPI00315C9E62
MTSPLVEAEYSHRPSTGLSSNSAASTITNGSLASNTIFNYSINNNQSIHIIPSLDDLLDDSKPKDEYYTKQNFVNFLNHIHCVENLEFVMGVNDLIRDLDSAHALQIWQSIYNQFISSNSYNEINLPCDLRMQFNEDTIPTSHLLGKSKRIIYDDILINLYNEFVKAMKVRMEEELRCSNIVYRRKSEIISPESSMLIDYNGSSAANSNANIIDGNGSKANYLDPSFYPDLFVRGNCKAEATTVMVLDESIVDLEDDEDDEDEEVTQDARNPFSQAPSRNNSASSHTSNSRGSSIGSIMDTFKNNDYIKFKKVKKFKFRRASSDEMK